MCGHGTIGTVIIMIEEGLVGPAKPGQLRLEVPAGLVIADYQKEGDKVSSVKIKNVASFLEAQNLEVKSPDLCTLVFDLAYGGNIYAIIDPQKNYGGLQNYKADQLIRWSRKLRKRINGKYSFVHPEDDRINGLHHIMWTGEAMDQNATARNAVFDGDNAIDRSPCGTGTSARRAQWAAKWKLKKGQKFVHESIIGSKFIGRIEEEATGGDKSAIIPSIEGWARIYGYNTITIDDDNP